MFQANNFYFHRIIITSNTERFSVKSQAARLQVFKADDFLQFPVKRELKHATLLSHGRQPEVNILHVRTVVSPRYIKLIVPASEKRLNNINVLV